MRPMSNRWLLKALMEDTILLYILSVILLEMMENMSKIQE